MKKNLLKLLSIAVFSVIGTNISAQIVFKVNSPANIQGTYPFSPSNDGTGGGWGADLSDPAMAVTGLAVLVDDGTAGDSLGCNALINAGAINSNIAVIYRGGCEFGAKALEAQNAGAIAAVIINAGPNATDPTATPGMGAGAVGSQVTIPVVMISVNTGALLRQYIDAGTLNLFIGSKAGLFAYDLGMGQGDVVRARSYAFPLALNPLEGKDTVWVGAQIVNYGNTNQTDAMLNAKISLNGINLYDETSSTPTAINTTDTAFIALPFFKPSLPGIYTLTYSAFSSNTDGDTADNMLVTHFIIQDSIYAKCRIDSVTGLPVANAFYRPSTAGTTVFRPCVIIDEGANSDQLSIYGISFALSSGTYDLTGTPVTYDINEWTDPTNVDFNNVTPVATGTYTYTDDKQSRFVSAQLAAPFQLVDDMRYLVCVNVDNVEMYFGYDTGLDYTTTTNVNNEYYFPLYDDGAAQWYGTGFGSNIVPSIVVHTQPMPVGVKEVSSRNSITPYPNPAKGSFNIPLLDSQKGTINVQVYDIVGQIVKSETISVSANVFSYNTLDMKNGSYFFKLTFKDNSQTSFKVSVIR